MLKLYMYMLMAIDMGRCVNTLALLSLHTIEQMNQSESVALL